MKILKPFVLFCILLSSLMSFLALAASVNQAEKVVSDKTVITIGIFPRRNANVTEKLFKPLQKELSETLNRKVELTTTYDFASFWENVSQQKYDLVHYNQYHYIKSHKLFGYNVVAQNVEFNQERIASAISVRKNSGINSLQDLKGKKIVFGGGRSAMVAYIATTYLLRQAGLKDGDYFEQFALNPPKAVIATYYRQAAAAGASNYILNLPQVKNKIKTHEMKYLAIGEKMANLPWAIKADLPDEVTQSIQNFMLNLHTTDKGKAVLKSARINRFIPATNADYNPHRQIVESVLGEDY